MGENTRFMFYFQITWLDGSGAVITEGITKETEEVENTKRLTAISILKFTAKKAHHNTTLTCQAQNPADRQPKSAAIQLLVRKVKKHSAIYHLMQHVCPQFQINLGKTKWANKATN